MENISQKKIFDQEIDEINLGNIFRIILMQSKMLLLIVSLGTAWGLYEYYSATKIYKVSSLIQLFGAQPTLGSQIDLIGGDYSSSSVDMISQLYTSRSHVSKIVEGQKLNITTSNDSIDLDSLVNKLQPMPDVDDSSSVNKFEILFFEESFDLIVGEKSFKSLLYSQDFDVDKFEININKPDQDIESIEINYVSPDDVIDAYKYMFIITPVIIPSSFYSRTNGLVDISLMTDDVEKGIKLLNYANETFIKSSIETDSEQARKAINFIDQRISNIEGQLNQEKQNFTAFKETNSTIDVDFQVQGILRNISELEKKIDQADLDIAQAESNYTSSNPLYKQLIDKRDVLLSQKELIEQTIQNLPIAQQEYIDLFRELQLTENIYSELLNKKLEFSIKEASTLGNMRIVDDAYLFGKVSPTRTGIIISFLISLFAGLVFAIVRGIYFIPVTNPAEFEDNGIMTPIFGVIPVIEEDDDIAQNERFSQSLESLIVNINNKLGDIENDGMGKIILFTSPTPKNGKSFVTRNFAKKLAKVDKKVLLLDSDFKRGDQNNHFGFSKITVKDFNNISDENIEAFRADDNFYFIPKISRLGSSFQFVYSAEFNQKLDYFRRYFDYIVIDTSPILSVSDTSMLLTLADMNIFLARHELTKINEVKQLLSISRQIGVEFDGLVYNAYKKPTGYYGYYGLYGNYAYQYYAQKYLYDSYDYKKEG